MTETVEKWAATFWCGNLKVAKGRFKKTKKQFRLDKTVCEDGEDDSLDIMDVALGFMSTFSQDTDRLHDTRVGALDALYRREEQKFLELQERSTELKDRLKLIENAAQSI